MIQALLNTSEIEFPLITDNISIELFNNDTKEIITEKVHCVYNILNSKHLKQILANDFENYGWAYSNNTILFLGKKQFKCKIDFKHIIINGNKIVQY